MAAKYGTIGADSLVGTSGADSFWGRGGKDMLKGLAGTDNLYGEAGDDLLLGGLDDDRIDGGAGTDMASWNADGGTQGVTIDLGAGKATRDAEVDTLVGIENAKGSAYNDTIWGNGGNNVLHGAPGSDELHGREGNDTFVSGPGDDRYDGGTGRDLLDYSGVSGTFNGWGIQADLGDYEYSEVISIDGTDHFFLTPEAFPEALAGTKFNDRIVGTYEGGETLSGGLGDDVIWGLTGSDTLSGGPGADWINPDDTLDDSASMGTPDILDLGNDASQDVACFVYDSTDATDIYLGKDQVKNFDKAEDLIELRVASNPGQLDARDFLDSNDDGKITAADREVSRSGNDLVLDIGAAHDRAFDGGGGFGADTVTITGAWAGLAASRIINARHAGDLLTEDMLF
jgi:Ca2+-binding RTX toxin-like protein